MAKLDINRLGNQSKVNRVDNLHNQLEEAIEEIFGIPDNTEITSYVFGVNPEDQGKPIQTDGSIRGVPVLKSSGPQATPSTAVGFKFDDGTTKKLLAFVDNGTESVLLVYKDDDYPNEDWDQVASVEVPGSGKLTQLTDWEGPTTLTGTHNGKLVKCTGTGFDLQDPAAGAGVTEFTALSDAPAGGYGVSGQVVRSTGAGLEWYTLVGSASPWVLMVSANSIEGWGSTNTWRDMYGWDVEDPEGSGQYVVPVGDESLWLDDDGDDSDKFFINLEPGAYEISMYYWTADGMDNGFGSRQWRVQGTDLYGPAVVGVSQRAPAGFNENGGIDGIDGAKYLGTRLLIVGTKTTDMKIQAFQDSGVSIGTSAGDDCIFYAVIRKVN